MKSEGARNWVYSYRLGDVINSLLVLALPRVEFAALLPAIGTQWVEPNPRTNIRDCLVEGPLGRKRQSAVMKGRCVSAA